MGNFRKSNLNTCTCTHAEALHLHSLVTRHSSLIQARCSYSLAQCKTRPIVLLGSTQELCGICGAVLVYEGQD